MKYCFGIDIGGTSIKIGLFTIEGEILDKWEISTRIENQGESILADIAAAILSKMEERQIARENIVGVGMGIPAPVDEYGVVKNTANLGWGYKEVTRELEELLGDLPVVAGNDANVAALGEMWLGAGKGEKNIVMVTLGTGVGGGIIVDGRIVVGATGAAGEIGHMYVEKNETETCGCGNTGCLEQYASATGICRLAQRRLAENDDDTILRRQRIDTKVIFEAVKEGDAVAIQIAECFGKYLGEAMVSLAAIVNPAVIVIGGGVSKAGEVILPYIQKPFKERAFFANTETRFVLATLGNDAGICGAARLILG